LKEKPISIEGIERVYSGKRIDLLKVHIKVGEYRTFKEVIDFGEAVAILPIIDKNNVILIRQFRVPINRWIYEVPAGKVEEGETLEETAVRELIEETGYRPKHLKKLISIYPTPGYSNEIIHVFLAYDLEYVGAKPEKSEVIQVVSMSIESALETILKDDIVDGKTLITLLTYKLFKEKTLPPP